jgi:putative sterol carrier protein
MIEVPEDITFEDYFKDYIIKQFEDTKESTDLSWMSGKEMTYQYNVDGKKCCLKIKDGTDLDVLDGGIDKPMLEVMTSEAVWRDTVTGKETGMDFIMEESPNVSLEERYKSLGELKGTLKIEIETDGGVEKAVLVFNGETEPEATITLTLSDWLDMQKGETDGQTLVMGGKLQFDGDLMFLLSAQSML